MGHVHSNDGSCPTCHPKAESSFDEDGVPTQPLGGWAVGLTFMAVGWLIVIARCLGYR